MDNSTTTQSLSDLILTIKRLQAAPAAARELTHAKLTVGGSSIDAGDSSSDVLGMLAELSGLGLSVSESNARDEHIRAVSADDVQRVAKQYFDLDHAIVVIVGDGARLKRVLPSLGLGTPEVR